jgi:hypothetical protein
MATLHELNPSLILRSDPRFNQSVPATLGEIVRKSILKGQDINEIKCMRAGDLNLSDLGMLIEFVKLEELSIAIQDGVAIPPLSVLTSLRKVSLQATGGVDLSPVALAPNIKSLTLMVDQGFETEQLASFAALQSLKIIGRDRSEPKLKFDDPFAGATWLQKQSNLKELYVSGTICHSLKGFQGLKELEELSIHDVDVGDFDALQDCRSLRSLNFGLMRPSDLSALARLTELESLHLFGDLQDLRIDPVARNDSTRELTICSSACPDLSALLASPVERELIVFKSSLPEKVLEELKSARQITVKFPK